MTNGSAPDGYAPPGARGVELADQPTTSLVVIADGTPQDIGDSLAAAARAEPQPGEIVVVTPPGAANAGFAAGASHIRFVAGPDDDPRMLRATGVAHATGAVLRVQCAASAVADERRPKPLLSVIVPAHQAAGILDRTLGALVASEFDRSRWELIVVDDASCDRTELVAAAFADVIVRLAGNPHGPAYARNRGAELSRGDVLVFVDADVTVHPDALGRIARHFSTPDTPAAVFGSYDVTPSAQSLPSQYRNLLHHFVHQRHAGPAETFWSGLGAIRASVFRDVGMFDEWHYSRPQIEDIELGRRLRTAGHPILLDPSIQGTHMKEWTVWNILSTDFQHRGVPWMWLILHEGAAADSQRLNVGRAEQVCTALVALALASVAVALLWWTPWPLAVAGAACATVIGMNMPFYRYLRRHRSLRFSVGVLPLHLSYYVVNVIAAGAGWLVYQLLGAPAPSAERQAPALVGMRSWPPPIRPPSRSTWQPHSTAGASAAPGGGTPDRRT